MRTDIVWYIMLPGIVIHEIAHLFAVWVTPNIKVDSFDLTSEVRHSGHYTVIRSMLISYIPLFFNTFITILLYYISQNYFNSYTPILQELISIIIFLLGFIISISAIPSYQDTKTPIRMMKEQLFTRRFPIIILLSPIYLTISIPTVLFAYVSQSNYWFNIISGVSYSAMVSLIYFGYIDVSEFVNYIDFLIVNLRHIIDYILSLI